MRQIMAQIDYTTTSPDKTINYVGTSAFKAIYRRCNSRMDSFSATNHDILSRLDTIEQEVINIASIAGTLPMYTMSEYNTLKQDGKLEHKMYCIYKNGILTRIYIYETLIAKRAQEGQIATGSTFPIIFPIIFA